MDIDQLLQLTVDKNASDLHISTGLPPILRLDGELVEAEKELLTKEAVDEMLHKIMNDKQYSIFKERLEFDFAYALSDKARFRVNAFHQARGYSIAFRLIPYTVPTLEELNLPEIFKELTKPRNGLVLVTGPTGSGKTTTLAAMVDYINENTQKHILTIEDPIEFTHNSKKCLINQREIHRDTESFSMALRSALREDPDVILVGEMRDLETIRLALTAAETGHLVFATLHTNSAAKTIDRVIDVFPGGEKDMIRSMLSESLRGVVSQTLLKRREGGRVAALEIMVCTHAIRNLIRENKVPQIYSAIQTGQMHGMKTLEQHIEELVTANLIEKPDTEIKAV